MCGICGKWNFSKNEKVGRELLERMCHVIRHRGPDDKGIYLDGALGLGVRRLSIIDLVTGHQPIHNEDKSIWIVCNGEIYNYLELREFLLKKGHRFYTKSDTETIVHMYEEFGDECVKKFNGMFAFAVWDKKNNRLLLARDRLGIKPLFYTIQKNKLVFGSEIKSILQDPEIPRELNLAALHNFISLNYIPAPQTIFEGIKKLLPGHILILSKDRLTINKYWDLVYSQEPEKKEEYYSERLLELLKKSVKRRLMSDVPLGVLLSGGLDSSTVTALMSELADKPVKTFSIGFEEKSFDELKYARIIAKHFGTEHYEFVVKPDILDLLSKILWHFDEPFADSSAIPVYHVAKIARNHVIVALSGDGGDEVFAGYETYAAYRAAQLYQRLPHLIRTLIPQIVHKLPTSDKKVSFDYKAKRFIQGSELSPEEGHYSWKVIFDEDAKKELYLQSLSNKLSSIYTYDIFKKYYEECKSKDILDKLQYADTKVYLANDILVKVDKMSMANSLETRVPLLDHQLVEFVASIPSSLRLKNFKKKYILKKTMKGILPSTILQRKKKGFSIPASSWIKNELKELVLDILSPQETKPLEYFNSKYIQNMLKEHFDNKKDHSRPIWGLLSFILWYKIFMQNVNTPK